jgi:hypothetical protein
MSSQAVQSEPPRYTSWDDLPPGPWLGRWARWTRWGAWAAVFLSLGTFLFVALRRLPYPFELEWLEGGILQHVERLAAGAPIYVEPSLEFIPFAYTPLYFHVSAAAARVFGGGFFALRLVSLLASLGVLALVFAIPWRATRGALSAGLAAGLFAATYAASGFWLDLARPDALFLFFLLLGVYLVWVHPGRAGSLAAGIAFGLSFLTKQTALACVAPLVLYLLVVRRRQGAWIALSLIGLIVSTTVIYDAATDGWYSYYAFRLRRGIVLETLNWNRLATFWIRDLAAPLGIALALGIFYFVRRAPRWSWKAEGVQLALMGSLILGAWASRLEDYAFTNVNLPAHAAVAILAGLGTQEALGPATRHATRRQTSAAIYLGLVWMLQFVGLAYKPAEALPTARDERAGRLLVDRLRATDGRVFLPLHPYLLERAARSAHAHAMGIADVQRGDARGYGRVLTAALDSSIAERRFSAVVLDDDWLREQVEREYVRAGRVFADPRLFRTVAGTGARPQFVYVPRPAAESSDPLDRPAGDRQPATRPASPLVEIH